MNIDKIIVKDVLPLPLRHEQHRHAAPSQIWQQDCVEFCRGQYYQLESESGGGKSSLCAFLDGLRSDYEGQILFDGQDISSFSIEKWCQLRRKGIAYLPQHLMLFPELTVMENIMLKNRLTGYKSHESIMQMLQQAGIAQKANTLCSLLSLGQQQRAAIVRALCQPFSFLLLDEPVSHLDENNNAEMAALIAQEASSQGAAVITTSVGNRLLLPTEAKLMKL